MTEWYWVLLFAASGTAFLFGRWCGIRDFEKEMDRSKHTCVHGVDQRGLYPCVECEDLDEDSRKTR